MAVALVAACWLAIGSGNALADTFTVTSTADSGNGTLRWALEEAGNRPGEDTIGFAASVTGTINLQTPLPAIGGELAINGPGRDQLTVRPADDAEMPGDGVFRLITVTATGDVKISALALRDGRNHFFSGPQGGAILNHGKLRLHDVEVSGSEVRAQPGFPGHQVRGGAIYSEGELEIRNSVIRDNVASTGGMTGGARGGGIYVSGKFGMFDTAVTGNVLEAEDPDDSGGAAILVADGDATISRSYIAGNRGPDPTPLKPIAAISNIAADLTINATTITGNDGGVNFHTVGHTRILNSTLVGGEEGTGPNLAVIPLDRGPLLYLGSSILVAADGWPNCDVADLGEGVSFSLGNNIADDTSCARSHCGQRAAELPDGKCRFLDARFGDRQGIDPGIGPLIEAELPYFPLQVGSPAINRGNSFGYGRDQLGNRRPRGCPTGKGVDGSDIGAIESAAVKCRKPKANQVGGRYRMRITSPGNGRLILTGPGLKKVTRNVAARKPIRVQLRPKPALRRRIDRNHRVTLHVKVRIKAPWGETLVKTRRVTLKDGPTVVQAPKRGS